ncbi:MAG TPA: hypothetical protein VNA67_07980 [Pseudonocardiaceae bacterium]|nr:hypothetical protein [Pseudonocardiaceae bacterium]
MGCAAWAESHPAGGLVERGVAGSEPELALEHVPDFVLTGVHMQRGPSPESTTSSKTDSALSVSAVPSLTVPEPRVGSAMVYRRPARR